MSSPKCKRFHRECDEFSICVNIGEQGYVLAEHYNERFTSFYYLIYGSGKFGRLFDSNYLNLCEKKIIDVQDYFYDEVIFHALEDFHLIGFNTYDKNVKWKSRLINLDEKKLIVSDTKSFLICFNGNPVVNDKKFKRYDYSKLNPNKNYEINLSDNDVLALFTKV
jgi:hypothetical protein